jgi:hypothetical protein
MFRVIVTSDLEQRQVWLNEVEMMIDRYFSKNNNNGVSKEVSLCR